MCLFVRVCVCVCVCLRVCMWDPADTRHHHTIDVRAVSNSSVHLSLSPSVFLFFAFKSIPPFTRSLPPFAPLLLLFLLLPLPPCPSPCPLLIFSFTLSSTLLFALVLFLLPSSLHPSLPPSCWLSCYRSSLCFSGVLYPLKEDSWKKPEAGKG